MKSIPKPGSAQRAPDEKTCIQKGSPSSPCTPLPLAGEGPGVRVPRFTVHEGGAPHHQAPLPTTWSLAYEATLPGGRLITGTAARVYHLLAETRNRQHRWKVGRHLAPMGWVPTWVLREPWAGGAAGDRRLRDLREAGVTIESQRFDAGDGEPASASWLWRIADPDSPLSDAVDLSNAGRSTTPLQGLTIRFTTGVLAPAALDISPGASSPLAPSFGACDDEAYRRELLDTFHSGRLVSTLTGRKEWTLWTDPAAAYDPRPVLSFALAKLGATLGP